MRALSTIILVTISILGAVVAAEPLLELKETFGVSHPDQLLFFAPARQVDPNHHSLLDADGRSRPFQLLSDGRIAVRTDLPAGAHRLWQLDAKASAEPDPQVTVSEADDHWEIANELLAIRIAKAQQTLDPTPAPIQGLRLRDGTWTALGMNTMHRNARQMRTEFLERGPLLVRLRVVYEYDRAELRGNYEPVTIPAGIGDYSCTIEVQAGQPSILFEEESTVDLSWSIPIHHGLTPTQARYRGHHSNSVEAGRDAAGNQYGAVQTAAGINYNGARGQDAIVDLDYDGGDNHRFSRTRYPYLSHWDPWAVDTGYYWMLFNPDAEHDNLLGAFAGPASRLIGPGVSGVSFDTRTAEGERYTALQVRFQRLKPTQYYDAHIRFGWGLFLGRTSEDLQPPDAVQSIQRQMNLHAGVNLTTLLPLPDDYPDPPQGYGSVFVGDHVWRRLAAMLQGARADSNPHFANHLKHVETSARDLIEFWEQPTREKLNGFYLPMTEYWRKYLDTLVNGEGIYEHATHYFMGCLQHSGYLLKADQALASGLLTEDEKRLLKQQLALIGHLLWENNLVPMHAEARVNLGPANMSPMWLGTRYKYTALLANHPAFTERVKAVRDETVMLIERNLNEAGSSNACPHYTGASMVPVLDLLQQLQIAGVWDGFADIPRVAAFGEYELNLLTPPEIRFGGLRKIIPVGDGSTEDAPRLGQLATGLAPSNPALSARLIQAWYEMGCPHNQFHGTSLLKIDDTLPAAPLRLGDAHLPGAYSVLRHGAGTPAETAVWMVNGDWHFDHRHNDNGNLLIYALGAPLSVDWGPIYYPRVEGGMLHSIVLPETNLQEPWDAPSMPVSAGTTTGGVPYWSSTEHLPFDSRDDRASMGARFHWRHAKQPLSWQRLVSLEKGTSPIIRIEDSFDGEGAAGTAFVSTLLLMAEGPVETPFGPIEPEVRLYDNRDVKHQELPSASPGRELAAGRHRFRFTGQFLIDFDLYVEVSEAAAVSLGNWGHTWHPSREARQFQKATGKPFSETQHILRVRTSGPLRYTIVPYLKGHEPEIQP